MIFCFVRETKQLTLEELDRKINPTPAYKNVPTNISRRGLLGPNFAIPQVRIDDLAALFLQETYFPQENREAAANHREGGYYPARLKDML